MKLSPKIEVGELAWVFNSRRISRVLVLEIVSEKDVWEREYFKYGCLLEDKVVHFHENYVFKTVEELIGH